MHIHLQRFVPQYIQRYILIHGTGILFTQLQDLQCHCLLIQFTQLRISCIHHPLYSGRHHIIYRCFRRILLQIHHRHIKHRIRILHQSHLLTIHNILILSPIIAHQIQTRHTQNHTVLKPFQNHPHKTDRLEITDSVNGHPTGSIYRNLDLIPLHLLRIPVGQNHGSRSDTVDEILPDFHLLRRKFQLIAEISLRLIQRIVAIDILHVRQ